MNKDILKKWSPVILDRIKIANQYILWHICNYCEWHSNTIDNIQPHTVLHRPNSGSDLVSNLSEIFKKLEQYNKPEIIGRFLNLATGIEEIKLSNGLLVNINSFNYEPSFKSMMDIFGIEYIKFSNIQEFRNSQIDQII